jgi:hypothetical protein
MSLVLLRISTSPLGAILTQPLTEEGPGGVDLDGSGSAESGAIRSKRPPQAKPFRNLRRFGASFVFDMDSCTDFIRVSR